MLRTVLVPVVAAGLWVTISEFVRNELLLKPYWTAHYAELGLVFPSEPANGIVWMIWSLCFAGLIFAIRQRFTFPETLGLCWAAGFLLMWLVTGNMAVLPCGILPYAIPLSVLEVGVAIWIIDRLKR